MSIGGFYQGLPPGACWNARNSPFPITYQTSSNKPVTAPQWSNPHSILIPVPNTEVDVSRVLLPSSEINFQIKLEATFKTGRTPDIHIYHLATSPGVPDKLIHRTTIQNVHWDNSLGNNCIKANLDYQGRLSPNDKFYVMWGLSTQSSPQSIPTMISNSFVVTLSIASSTTNTATTCRCALPTILIRGCQCGGA